MNLLRALVKVICAFGLLVFLVGIVIPPMPPGNIGGQTSSWMQAARRISLAMTAYANDHHGQYPDGASSTEVFQKLLEGGYVNDSRIFYIPLPGKIEPVPGKKLKPENICFDVTSGVDAGAPDGLPIVFMTGYNVTYASGGTAVPVIKPYPPFGSPRTWTQWRYGYQISGLAVAYKNNNARLCRLVFSDKSEASVPNFVAPDFDPQGKTYRQLTPGANAAAAPPAPPLPPSAAAPVAGQPWVNRWGVKFVPAGTDGVLFSVWDVRLKDFRAFVDATGYDATHGMVKHGTVPWQSHGITWKDPGFAQTEGDPVVKVSWNDAKAFCQWLTKQEQAQEKMTASQFYRLPTDAEWSKAVGLDESREGVPGSKRFSSPGIFPWGTQWPPPDDAGNFNFESDQYEGSTSPVGSFAANPHGLYDMSGNVWQWCEDAFDNRHDARVLRGGSWSYNVPNSLLSSFRERCDPGFRRGDAGFRVVVVVSP